VNFFFALTPDCVLNAVEQSGFECTGRCLTLNSFENRVYDIEIQPTTDSPTPASHLSTHRRIAKFYRPGRWTQTQILEEHQFLKDLQDAEIPVVAPIPFPDGSTLQKTPSGDIWYALFPRVGGRTPDEPSQDQLLRIGRLLGRIHSVGASRKAPSRHNLCSIEVALQNARFLLDSHWIPIEFAARYQKTVEEICKISEPRLEGIEKLRIHGDCHLGNLLWNDLGPFFLDFDDMMTGIAAQDLWLLTPGRDAQALLQREVLVEGYCEFRKLERTSLRLIESLRALRFLHYSAWLARRWEDPAFPKAFPQFGSHSYWNSQVEDLEEQLRIIKDH
jgi:Ser/Thr protein kinase RdoA (MazF antagonist)